MQNARMPKARHTCPILAFLAILALVAIGCKSSHPPSSKEDKMYDIQVPVGGSNPGPSPLPFQISDGPSEWDPSKPADWLCSVTTGKQGAKFRVHIDALRPMEREMFSGKGRFIAEPGSEASEYLQHLKSALSAKQFPTNAKRVESLPFEIVVLGRNRAHKTPIGFSGPGSWTAAKLFLGQGDTESQVFFNLDPAHREGEFSMKDEEYGDAVLAELAKVL